MEIYIDPNTNTDKILNSKELNQKLINVANAIKKEYVRGKPRPSFIAIKPKYRIGDNFRRIISSLTSTIKKIKHKFENNRLS